MSMFAASSESTDKRSITKTQSVWWREWTTWQVPSKHVLFWNSLNVRSQNSGDRDQSSEGRTVWWIPYDTEDRIWIWESQRPWFKSQIHCLWAVLSWETCQIPTLRLTSCGIQGWLLNFLYLSFLICGVGTIIEPTTLGCYEYYINEVAHSYLYMFVLIMITITAYYVITCKMYQWCPHSTGKGG